MWPDYDPRTPWPPEGWEDVYRWYMEHSAWYSGDPERLARVYGALAYTPTPKGRFWARSVAEEQRVMLHVPIAGDIASTSADLLFSEPPRFVIPEAHEKNAQSDAKKTQDRLNEIISESGILHKLIEAAETSSAMGGVFLKINWDKDLANYPLLSVAQADSALPEFKHGILTAVVFWKVVREEGATVWRLLERHEYGLILYALFRGTEDRLGRQEDLKSIKETADLEEVIQTGLPGLATVYIPNKLPNRRMRGSCLGYSDYGGTEGLMDALDEVYTSWIRDIRLGQGRIIVPEYMLRKEDGTDRFKFDINQEVFVGYTGSPADPKPQITLSQFDIRTQEHRDASLELLDRIIVTAGYSPQSFGLKIEGRAESGTALRLRERKSLVTQGKKQGYWKKPLEDMLEALLMIDREMFSSGITVFRPRVDFEDSIAQDPTELAQSVEMLNRAQAASIKTKVKMIHPDWSDEEVDAEVKLILEEQGLSVPDPIQVGLP